MHTRRHPGETTFTHAPSLDSSSDPYSPSSGKTMIRAPCWEARSMCEAYISRLENMTWSASSRDTGGLFRMLRGTCSTTAAKNSASEERLPAETHMEGHASTAMVSSTKACLMVKERKGGWGTGGARAFDISKRTGTLVSSCLPPLPVATTPSPGGAVQCF